MTFKIVTARESFSKELQQRDNCFALKHKMGFKTLVVDEEWDKFDPI